MKKKKILLCVVCVAAIVLAAAVVLLKNNINISTGTYMKADNGSSLVILGNSPVVMEQRLGKEGRFSDFQTGNRILLVHDGVDASYPGATGVYFILKLSEGNEGDIPEEIINNLQELGWLQKSAAPS